MDGAGVGVTGVAGVLSSFEQDANAMAMNEAIANNLIFMMF